MNSVELHLTSGAVVLPGDLVASLNPPSDITLGNGVRLIRDTKVVCTTGGVLHVAEFPSLKVSVMSLSRIYHAAVGDLVVGTIQREMGITYSVDIGATYPATLDVCGFDGATRQNRPRLRGGDLVYARVTQAYKDVDPEITCCASLGVARKDWVTGESDFGQLKNGHVCTVPPQYARELLKTDSYVLQALSTRVSFELAIGVNGRVWVNAEKPKHILAIAHVIVASQNETNDEVDARISAVFPGKSAASGGAVVGEQKDGQEGGDGELLEC
eukprot:PhM_4_TR12760/c0_g1_i1/m.16075/K03681/RRP40, EXOSC3; exosome complex component RRP40